MADTPGEEPVPRSWLRGVMREPGRKLRPRLRTLKSNEELKRSKYPLIACFVVTVLGTPVVMLSDSGFLKVLLLVYCVGLAIIFGVAWRRRRSAS